MNFFKDIAQKIIDRYDLLHVKGIEYSEAEMTKSPSRTTIINYLLINRADTCYLEIGVRNPEDNFNHIVADRKYSVDPGLEFDSNPVNFQMTSNQFFDGLRNGAHLKGVFFDVIFIDGLHAAEQVELDIQYALDFVTEDGFIVLHDCNPPTEWHARETYDYKRSPAKGCWNGTTWKAFAQARKREDISACCIDSDWGVGIISKTNSFGRKNSVANPYWEFSVFNSNRRETLNLMSFEEFKSKLEAQ